MKVVEEKALFKDFGAEFDPKHGLLDIGNFNVVFALYR